MKEGQKKAFDTQKSVYAVPDSKGNMINTDRAGINKPGSVERLPPLKLESLVDDGPDEATHIIHRDASPSILLGSQEAKDLRDYVRTLDNQVAAKKAASEALKPSPLDVPVISQSQSAGTKMGEAPFKSTEVRGIRAADHVPPSARDVNNQTGVLPRRAPKIPSTGGEGAWSKVKKLIPKWMGGS